ncbi:MAG: efflux RND transporter periplasmic adaptor subunit [Isosphaeraceae bacterium]
MAAATEHTPRARGRVLRTLGGLALTAVFAAGIVGLMLVLAGRFEPKVGKTAAAPTASENAAGKARPEAVVALVKLPRREAAIGTIRAVYESVVASKILARVEEVRFKAGQEVKQGDVLILLDKADLKTKLEQAEASERAARSKYDQAEIDLGRTRRLRARESIPQGELDQSVTNVRTAQAELERARKAVEEAKIVEAYATVRAPISGRVIDKKVNAGDTVIPGQPLVTMYDPTHMQLVATVRESLALRLKVGQPIPARVDTFGYECVATVSEIVPEAQAESRSFQVKVTGPCPPGVYSGMFARIFIPMDEEDVLVVPPGAVRRVGQLEEVDVADGPSVQRRAVQLGRTLDQGREVLSGLQEGEHVLLHHTTPGRKESGR